MGGAARSPHRGGDRRSEESASERLRFAAPAAGPARSGRYTSDVIADALPGADLVRQGLEDLARGIESVPALLVAIGAPRLRRVGLDVPEGPSPSPEHRLYELLAMEDPDGAHSRYNALIRRLISFERAAECGGL